MKKLLNFLFLIGLMTIIGLNLSSYSESKSTTKTDKPDRKNQVITSKIDSSANEKIVFFHMPSLQKLADKSPILYAEAFGNEDEKIRYIVGDILILSVDTKIAYLSLLPKTTEDDNSYINLVVQNKNDNIPTVAKEWLINNDDGESTVLAEFYESFKDEILGILEKEKTQPLNQKLSLLPYEQMKETSLKRIFKTSENDLPELAKVQIDFNNQKSIILDQTSKNQLCSECKSLIIYNGDFLGEISIDIQKTKILILGFLERVDHSPSALHIRFVSAEK